MIKAGTVMFLFKLFFIEYLKYGIHKSICRQEVFFTPLHPGQIK